MKISSFFKICAIFALTYFTIHKSYSISLNDIYKNDLHNRPLLQILNYEIKLARQYALIGNKDLDNLDDIRLYIGLLNEVLSKKNKPSEKKNSMFIGPINLIDELLFRLSEYSLSPESVILGTRNVRKNLISIRDKTSLILGGSSPVAMQFYTEEILKHFNYIINGEDLDNSKNISLEFGEGGLEYISKWIISVK